MNQRERVLVPSFISFGTALFIFSMALRFAENLSAKKFLSLLSLGFFYAGMALVILWLLFLELTNRFEREVGFRIPLWA